MKMFWVTIAVVYAVAIALITALAAHNAAYFSRPVPYHAADYVHQWYDGQLHRVSITATGTIIFADEGNKRVAACTPGYCIDYADFVRHPR